MKTSSHILFTCIAAGTLLAGCDYLPAWMGNKKEVERLPGERITALPVKSNIDVDAQIARMPLALPPAQANAEWPQAAALFGTASSNLALSGALDDEESVSVGEGETFEHTLIPRPVVAGGMVFAMDAAGYVSAHDAENISNRRWQSAGVSEEDEPQVFGGGLAYDQGKIYATSGRGLIVAMDAATGKEIWRKATNIPFRSPPRVADGRLYAVSMDSQLYALNIKSGEILWSHRGINETAGMLRGVSPAVSGATVVVPYASGELYGLSAGDGRELWTGSVSDAGRTRAAAIFPGIGGDPVIDGDVVFAASSGGSLSVFNLWNGQRIWERPLSSINSPWLAGDYAFVLTSDNTLVAMVKYDSRVRWVSQLPGFEDEEDKKRPITWSGPVLADGKLLIVGSRGQLLLASAEDGKIVTEKSIPDDVYTPPVIAAGRMYLVSQDAKLYMFK